MADLTPEMLSGLERLADSYTEWDSAVVPIASFKALIAAARERDRLRELKYSPTETAESARKLAEIRAEAAERDLRTIYAHLGVTPADVRDMQELYGE